MLLMIAAGLLEPEEGMVPLNGRPIKEQLPEAEKRIGFVFQDPNDQLFNLTVYDEIAFALRQLALTEEGVNRKVMEMA